MSAWELHEMPALTCPWCLMDNALTVEMADMLADDGKHDCEACKRPFHWQVKRRYWTRRGDT